MAYLASDLINFVISKVGGNYVYGAWGDVLTYEQIDTWANLYPNIYTLEYIAKARSKVGTQCTDCSGLISWFTGNRVSSSWFNTNAIKKISINNIKDCLPGSILWKSGHVGVYIGMEDGVPMAVEARNINKGVIKSKVSDMAWTYVCMMGDCTYDVASGSEVDIGDIEDIIIPDIDINNPDSDNYIPNYDLVYDDTTIGYDGVTEYETIYFKIGDNIITRWVHTNVISGVFYYPLLVDIVGSGDMYPHKDDFICLTSNNITWDNLSNNSCNFYSQLAIAHDSLTIPEGITSIASHFFSGFTTRKLTLPSTLKTIGDYAFAPESCKIPSGFRQLIYELVIPANVEHIGVRAFADMEYCNKIAILNPDYIIEDYGSTGDGIFRMGQGGNGITYGSDIDEDNCFVTQLYSVNKENYKYNWKLNYRRSIKSEGTNCVRCYTSCGKILEISLYNDGEIPMYTDVLSYIKNGKLVELDDINASPVRVCVSDTTKKIMAVSY